MNDTTFGFLLLAVGIVFVLGVVFAISYRRGAAGTRPTPPRGVHLPPPSFLPVVMSIAGALLGAGLVFRSDDQLANPVLGIAGLLVLVAGVIAWVRAANGEWVETEHR